MMRESYKERAMEKCLL